MAQEGDRILVGAPWDNASLTNSGAGYAFNVTRTMQNLKLELKGQGGSTGFYALNVRPQVVINEIDARANIRNPFVELLGPPSFSLAEYQLCSYDSFGSILGCAVLSGYFTEASGYLALDYVEFGRALNLPRGAAGAVQLKRLGVTIDRVCWGRGPAIELCEATRAPVGVNHTIGRAAGVDTNQNDMDFLPMASSTPGAQNDRMAQSPLTP